MFVTQENNMNLQPSMSRDTTFIERFQAVAYL